MRKIRNIGHFIKVLLGGHRYEWRLDFDKAERPVLLIHGFAMPRQCMVILEKRLTADGYDVFGFSLGPANFLGVEKASRLIETKLNNLTNKPGLHKIAIVGHSLGGIIGRTYVSLYEGHRHCHTLITLGSPHQGHPAGAKKWSKLISWFTNAPKDLDPASDVMAELKKNPIPPSVYAASLYSEADPICPAELCPLDITTGSTHLVNVPLEGVNHIDFVADAHVYEMIKVHLEEGFRRAKITKSTSTSLPME